MSRSILVQQLADARQSYHDAEKVLRLFDHASAWAWNPPHPVQLKPGKNVMVRGCFPPSEVCSALIDIPEGVRANRLDVEGENTESKEISDKYDQHFRGTGMIKVEWYSNDGQYIKCWVDRDQIAGNDE